jgi:hypothetical protein
VVLKSRFESAGGLTEMIIGAAIEVHLLRIHSAQLLTYLKLSGKKIGLLMNFNEPVLTKGVKRLVNHFREDALTQRLGVSR